MLPASKPGFTVHVHRDATFPLILLPPPTPQLELISYQQNK